MPNSRLSPGEQLQREIQQGSAHYNPASKGPTVGFEQGSSHVHPTPLRSKWLPNFSNLYQQLKTEGVIETLRHKHLYQNQADMDVHDDNARTETARYGTDRKKLVEKTKHDAIAMAYLRKHGVYEFLKASNAIARCAIFYDEMLQRIDRDCKDEKVRDAAKDRLRKIYEQGLSEIHVISYGNQYDSERGRYGDEF